MASLRKLFGKLKLRINENKSKVTRPTSSQVPRLLVLGSQGTSGAAARSTRGHRTPEGACARAHPAQCRTQPRADLQAARNLPVGLVGLLPAHGGTGRACRHRRLDPPSAAGRATQALEAGSGHLPRAGRSRNAWRCSQESCRQQPPLVAQRGDGAQQGVAEHLRQSAGSPIDCELTSTHQTARCGPACRVVWQGTWRHDLHAPMPIGRTKPPPRRPIAANCASAVQLLSAANRRACFDTLLIDDDATGAEESRLSAQAAALHMVQRNRLPKNQSAVRAREKFSVAC